MKIKKAAFTLTCLFIVAMALVTPFIACAMLLFDFKVCILRLTAWILALIMMNFLTYRLVRTKSLAMIFTASCNNQNVKFSEEHIFSHIISLFITITINQNVCNVFSPSVLVWPFS